jgi:hypothetical protein
MGKPEEKGEINIKMILQKQDKLSELYLSGSGQRPVGALVKMVMNIEVS